MIYVDRIRYDTYARSYAFMLIRQTRTFLHLGPEEEQGVRFKDDDYVFCSLESMFTQSEFGKDPIHAVERALHEAGRSDYWYNHEVDYDDEPKYTDDNDEDLDL